MIASFDIPILPDVASLTGCALTAHRVRLLTKELEVWTTGAAIKVLAQGAAHQAACGYILRPGGDRRGPFKHRLWHGCLFLTMRRHDPTAKLTPRTYVGARHAPGAHAGRGGVADHTDDRQPQAEVDRCGSQRSRQMLGKG